MLRPNCLRFVRLVEARLSRVSCARFRVSSCGQTVYGFVFLGKDSLRPNFLRFRVLGLGFVAAKLSTVSYARVRIRWSQGCRIVVGRECSGLPHNFHTAQAPSVVGDASKYYYDIWWPVAIVSVFD